MLGAGMQLAQENAALACGDASVAFRGRAHAGKFLRRHDEEKLILGIGQKNEFLGTLSTPTGGDGDAIFLVDGVTKFAGVKGLSRGDAVHGPTGLVSTLIHFVPLLTTTAPCGQYFFFHRARKISPRARRLSAPPSGIEQSCQSGSDLDVMKLVAEPHLFSIARGFLLCRAYSSERAADHLRRLASFRIFTDNR